MLRCSCTLKAWFKSRMPARSSWKKPESGTIDCHVYDMKCRLMLHSAAFLESYEMQCKGNRGSLMTIWRAAPLSQVMLECNEEILHSTATDNAVMDSIIIYDTSRKMIYFTSLGPCRPRQGAALAINFVPSYRQLIQQCFYRGAFDQGKKMNATVIRKEIQYVHPDWYELPSSHHIGQWISTMMKSQHPREVATSEAGQFDRGESVSRSAPSSENCRPQITPMYITHFQATIEDTPKMMPSTAVMELQRRFGATI